MPFELECVHAPSRQITFLDTTITVDLRRRKIITNIYDKRSGMACYKNARTFPHRDSLLVDAQKYGVVTSQFIRYGRRISCMSDYLTATSDLAARMIVHGYDASLVRVRVNGFQKYWPRNCNHLGRWRDFQKAFPGHLKTCIDDLLNLRLGDIADASTTG
jgi:hypothetical protein